MSKYVVFSDQDQAGSQSLMYHTMTSAMLRIDNTHKKALFSLENDTASAEKLSEFIPMLKENCFVVEDDSAEDIMLENFFDSLQKGDPYIFQATVLTTYACNMACIYCFEEGIKDHVYMDDDTCDDVIDYIKRHVTEKKQKKILICFYGGEPLLNTEPMFRIASELYGWSAQHNIIFNCSMISNGTLLNMDIVQNLLKYGLESIRVSVDGMRTHHDSRRPMRGGGVSFDRIMENIKSVADLVPIEIVGTYDHESLPGIFEFIDHLDQEGLLGRLRGIGFSPLVPRLGPKDNPGKIELAECMSFIEGDGLIMETLKINRELLKRGLLMRTGLGINMCPMMMRRGAVSIDPKGKIYNCNSFIGHEDFSIGSVFDENVITNKYAEISAWKKCPKDCPYLPMCQGGCRFFAYTESKDVSAVCCKRGFYDRMIPEAIKLEYECMRKKAEKKN